MELGLAHSLSRYKLKFSPDKIDTMIVQVGYSDVLVVLSTISSILDLVPWVGGTERYSNGEPIPAGLIC